MTEAEFEDQVKAWMRSCEIDRTADYLRRGRQYAALLDEELIRLWKTAFHDLVANPGSEEVRLYESDLKSEIGLRGKVAPMDEVATALDELTQNFVNGIERLQAESPEQLAACDREIRQRVGEFLEQKQSSAN
jgi:hypothetical protein